MSEKRKSCSSCGCELSWKELNGAGNGRCAACDRNKDDWTKAQREREGE